MIVDRLAAASSEDPAQFVDEFRDRLQRSVTLHLLSDVPLAAMCSGGVDSSLIAAYAKDQIPGIEGYVADVQWPSGEGNQAERVGRHLGVPIRRIVVDQARFLRLWPYTVWHSDNPSLNPSDTALLAVVQACRADGIKVLLTGEGSDELFGGYPWQEKTYNYWRRLRLMAAVFLSRPPHGESCSALAPFARTTVPQLQPDDGGPGERADSAAPTPHETLGSDRVSRRPSLPRAVSV